MLKAKRIKTPALNRRQLLESIPRRNEALEALEKHGGGLTIRVPLKNARSAGWLARALHAPTHAEIELDDVGATVLGWCDGSRRVVDLIRRLKRDYKLDIKEAEVALLEYLDLLVSRGIVGLQLKAEESNGRETNQGGTRSIK